MNTKSLKHLLKLLIDHKNTDNQSPVEFLDALFEKEEISDTIAKLFLNLKRNEKIFECVMEHFCSVNTIKNDDKLLCMVMFYVLVIELNDETLEKIKIICTKLKKTMCLNMLRYMNCEEFLIMITEIASRVFDKNYTLEKIIRPLVAKVPLLEKLEGNCVEFFRNKEKIVPKPLTRPKSPRLTKRMKDVFQSVGTPVVTAPEPVLTTFTCKIIPATTYCGDMSIKAKIQEAHEKNRVAAMALLNLARTTAFNCSKTKERPAEIEAPKVLPIKPKKVPSFKDVSIKSNTAMLMREVALCYKTREKELKKLEDITNGAYDSSLYEAFEAEERIRIQQEHLQSIEKKHLQGLLTYEEALLAKQNYIENNKKKAIEIKAERENLNKLLNEWRDTEYKAMRLLVEKAQSIERNAKDAQLRTKADKHRSAQQLQQETKTLLDQAMAEKEAELMRKIELIKELKALQCLKDINRKEFDPTETVNLGLMCEMSIAELQQRLMLMQLDLKEELARKREQIIEARKEKQQLLENAKLFVEENRFMKESLKKPEAILKVQETPELTNLRNKILEIRQQRRSIV